MKKSALILATCIIMSVVTVSYSQEDKVAIAAIKATIEKETTSFFGVDRKNWEVNWLNAPYTYWSYADSTGSSFVNGTDNIQKNFTEYFQTAKPSKSKIEREWLEIRVYGKGAYVRFIQKVKDEMDIDVSSETHVLEKDKEGKWKIIFLSAIAKY